MYVHLNLLKYINPDSYNNLINNTYYLTGPRDLYVQEEVNVRVEQVDY